MPDQGLLDLAKQSEQEALRAPPIERQWRFSMAINQYEAAGSPEEAVRLAESSGYPEVARRSYGQLAPQRFAAGEFKAAMRAYGFSDPNEGLRRLCEYLDEHDPKTAIDPVVQLCDEWPEGQPFGDQLLNKLLDELRARGLTEEVVDTMLKSGNRELEQQGRALAQTYAEKAFKEGDLVKAARVGDKGNGDVLNKIEEVRKKAIAEHDDGTAALAEEALRHPKEAFKLWRSVAEKANEANDVEGAARAYEHASNVLATLESQGIKPLSDVGAGEFRQAAATAFEKRASVLSEEGNPLEAARILRKAAELRHALKQDGQAEKDWRACGKASSRAGDYLMNEGRYGEAIAAYESAAAAFEAEEALLKPGQVQERSEALTAAEAALKKAISAAIRGGYTKKAERLKLRLEELQKKQEKLSKTRVSAAPSAHGDGTVADSKAELPTLNGQESLARLEEMEKAAWAAYREATAALYGPPSTPEVEAQRKANHAAANKYWDDLSRRIAELRRTKDT